MSESSFVLIFNNNNFKIPAQFHGYTDCSKEIVDQLVFSQNHQYIVCSKVSDEVFLSLYNYMISETAPNIQKDNFSDFFILNTEFNILTSFINESQKQFGVDGLIITLLQDRSNPNKSMNEEHVAKNLDLFLLKYEKELSSLDIQTLYNIFSHKNRKLNDHELAYQFIKKYSVKDMNCFIILPFLNGKKLSRGSQIECEKEKENRSGFSPKMDHILSLNENQDRLNEIVQSHQRKIDDLTQLVNKLISGQNEKDQMIEKQRNEIDELNKTLIILKNSFEAKSKEYCFLNYLNDKGQDYRYKYIHIEANKATRLPFYYMNPGDNSICKIEYDPKGTKITLLKEGYYLLMFNIRCDDKLNELTKIQIRTERQKDTNWLNSIQYLQPNVNGQIISGHKICSHKANDYIYLTIEADKPINIAGGSSVNTSFEIIKL